MDKFGRFWPGNDPAEFCAECGQPDNCGDCNHRPLLEEQVRMLGGATVDELNRCGLIISEFLTASEKFTAAELVRNKFVRP